MASQNTMQKTNLWHKKKTYRTLESMQKLEKDVNRFQEEIVNVYIEALKQDNENEKAAAKEAKAKSKKRGKK